MDFTRRETLALGAGAAAMTLLPAHAFAQAAADAEMVGTPDEFLAGASASEGGLDLTAPEIAENGNTVPISVDAPGAVEVRVYALGNPTPGVATFRFGPLSGAQFASTRIRLAGTQDVQAIAKMADGSYVTAMKTVKVTIGGCGG
ncbi:thiosulfate oxidation carrier protein SoxY [Pseudoponticoccus marisrubri]|uniref:Thiosulfate oxidation carrier protein SoxY n=1 Tax=Pseudoponticoccus marisrubri TaxID=1685382 RepID=A0A0W7WFI5_9RHOB|nr:thiosulfate oxidation carrier protein SoxY [Pseudoponticoccus marisrubri]KUF09279.1 thiosulfate oxidation carrier protein SoxY [Pseudoponticoccus marisrubri]